IAEARTASVRPDFACMSRTTSTMPSRTSSGAWMTRSTPSPRTVSSGSVTRAATSMSRSRPRSSPVISQSIHTSTSDTWDSVGRLFTRARGGCHGKVARAVAGTYRSDLAPARDLGERDGGRHRGVERLDLAADGDRHPQVAGLADQPGEPTPLGADHYD